jgi:hypothetical protein
MTRVLNKGTFHQGGVEGAGMIAWIDGILAGLLLIAYFLSKGYTAWKLLGRPSKTSGVG